MNRTVVTNDIEIRVKENGSMLIRGMLPTNSLSHTLYNKKKRRFFKEMILSGAFQEVISKKTPQILLQHDFDKSQKLICFEGSEYKNSGYHFEAEITPTQELIDNIDNINGLSFMFVYKDEEWKNVNGQYLRKIKSFKEMKEISILYGNCQAAYPATRVVVGKNKSELSKKEIKVMKSTISNLRYEQMKERLKDLRK